jgi:hypothetical protein
MKVVRSHRISYRSSLLLIILTLCIPAAAQARILIHDAWAASGTLTLENADWAAVFSREEGALVVYSKMKETMKIVPFYMEDRGFEISGQTPPKTPDSDSPQAKTRGEAPLSNILIIVSRAGAEIRV